MAQRFHLGSCFVIIVLVCLVKTSEQKTLSFERGCTSNIENISLEKCTNEYTQNYKFREALGYLLQHQRNCSINVLRDLTEGQCVIIGFLGGLALGYEDIVKLSVRSASFLKYEEMNQGITWAENKFELQSELLYKSIKNYVMKQLNIEPVLIEFIVRISETNGFLDIAYARNDTDVLEWLLEKGINPDLISERVLQYIMGNNKKQIIEKIIKKICNSKKNASRYLSRRSQMNMEKQVLSNYIKTIVFFVNRNYTSIEDVIILSLKHNHSSVFREFIPEIAYSNATVRMSDSILNTLISKESVDMLEDLLATGYPVDAIHDDGLTLLYKYIEQNATECIDFLIKAGANVNAQSHCNWTLLHEATHRKDQHVISKLLSLGANMFSTDCNGLTPMHIAILNNDTESIKLLLKYNFHMQNKFNSGNTLLHFAAVNGTDNILQFLIENYDFKIDAENDEGETPLFLALLKNRTDTAQVLLDKGSDINQTKIDQTKYLRILDTLALLKTNRDQEERRQKKHQNSSSREIPVPLNVKKSDIMIDLHEATRHKDVIFEHQIPAVTPNSTATDVVKDTPLQLSAIQDHPDILKEVLSGGARNLNARNSRGWRALHEAAKHDRIKVVKGLLMKGADPNSRTNDTLKYTPLQLSCIYGHEDIVRELLRGGADVNAGNSKGWTALHEAAKHGHNEVVKELIIKGADPNSRTNDTLKYTPLQLSSIYGHENIVRELLKGGADVNAGNSRGWTSLHEAAKHGYNEVVKELIIKGADPNSRTNDTLKYTPLQLSAIHGHAEIVKELLRVGADDNIRNTKGWAAIHEAAKYGHKDVLNELLLMGADPNSRTTDMLKYTPLLVSAIHGHLEFVRELLRGRADINAANRNGWTGVHEASKHGHSDVVMELVVKGADPNSRTTDALKYTPLQLSSIYGHEDVVRELLSGGADVNAGNSRGWTALHEAAKHGHNEVVKELLVKGADPNRRASDNLKYTPLQLSAIHGHSDVVRELLSGGADVNAGNSRGWTALHEAAKHGHNEVVKELLVKGADPNCRTTDEFKYTPLQLSTQDDISKLLRRQ